MIDKSNRQFKSVCSVMVCCDAECLHPSSADATHDLTKSRTPRNAMVLRVNIGEICTSMFCRGPAYLDRTPPSRESMVAKQGSATRRYHSSPYGEPRNPTPVINIV